MTFILRLKFVGTIPQQDSAERALNKLCRTFAIQLETLKRIRSSGEQKVTVRHVSVNEGGQAIVGNVTHTASKAMNEHEHPNQGNGPLDERQADAGGRVMVAATKPRSGKARI